MHYLHSPEGIQSALKAVSTMQKKTIKRVTYDCSISRQLSQILEMQECINLPSPPIFGVIPPGMASSVVSTTWTQSYPSNTSPVPSMSMRSMTASYHPQSLPIPSPPVYGFLPRYPETPPQMGPLAYPNVLPVRDGVNRRAGGRNSNRVASPSYSPSHSLMVPQVEILSIDEKSPRSQHIRTYNKPHSVSSYGTAPEEVRVLDEEVGKVGDQLRKVTMTDSIVQSAKIKLAEIEIPSEDLHEDLKPRDDDTMKKDAVSLSVPETESTTEVSPTSSSDPSTPHPQNDMTTKLIPINPNSSI